MSLSCELAAAPQDSQTDAMVRNRIATEKLLDALVYHHGTDANMHPPIWWRKREDKPKAEAKVLVAVKADITPLPISADMGLKVEDVKREVCKYFGLSQIELTSARRGWETVRPRQIAMHLTKQFTGRSLPEIGRRFGKRDHTTVMSAIRRVKALCQTDWMIAYDVAHLEVSLSGRFQCEP